MLQKNAFLPPYLFTFLPLPVLSHFHSLSFLPFLSRLRATKRQILQKKTLFVNFSLIV